MEKLSFLNALEKLIHTNIELLDTEKNVFKELLEMDKTSFNIGNEQYYAFDKWNVKRCFNCWGFNHEASKYTNKKFCQKCGEQKLDDCKSLIIKH